MNRLENNKTEPTQIRITLLNNNSEQVCMSIHNDLVELDIACRISCRPLPNTINIQIVDDRIPDKNIAPLTVYAGDAEFSPIEQIFWHLEINFDELPLLKEGESKIVRLLTPKLVIEKFKPSVYSYTYNRYDFAEGTDRIRALFSAAVFRHLQHGAFISLIEQNGELLTIQRRVDDCNLEVRVKRYHVGSPVHRYLYTERHSSTQNGIKINKWCRFDEPIVCFDWRHPLEDEEGRRLADEPLSDDYAALWMDNTVHAKQLAKETFKLLEERFSASGLELVDICFFIDRSGHIIFGEISPDCMRIKQLSDDIANADSLDKDNWRSGHSKSHLYRKYKELLLRVFPEVSKKI